MGKVFDWLKCKCAYLRRYFPILKRGVIGCLKKNLWVVTGFCAVLFVWSIYPFLMDYMAGPSPITVSDGSPDPDVHRQAYLGAIGDSFGALNTLFSGLAFAGIIISIFLQSKELKETREEVKNQGEQLKSQAETMDRQLAVMDKQAFETTFFQMLKLHQDVVGAVVYGRKNSQISGLSAIHEMAKNLMNEQNGIKRSELSCVETKSSILECYMKFYGENESRLGHYFRNLYHILKLVDGHDLEEGEKKFYVNVVRSQLSNSDFILLFYNGLSAHGSEKFKPLLEKYEFFEHLTVPDYFLEFDIFLYEKNAYGITNTRILEKYKAHLEEGGNDSGLI